MVSQIQDFVQGRPLNTILSAIAALGAAGAFLAVLMGWVTVGATNAQAIQSLQQQMTLFGAQIEKLSTKISNGPQSIQMKQFDHDLSALGGRMDGMDSRVGSDERELTKVQTDVENIKASSDARLQGHQR